MTPSVGKLSPSLMTSTTRKSPNSYMGSMK
jgi:hypothetical protein